MAIPLRHADPTHISPILRTFFVTSSIKGKRNLLQSDRSAKLFIDVLYHYRSERKYLLHGFVVMPDHFHALLTLDPEISIERAVQFIKGSFAFRGGKEFGFKAPVWQRGFSEARIYDSKHFTSVLGYMGESPMKRGLAPSAMQYPYCSVCRGFQLDEAPQGLKPKDIFALDRHV
ncbi:MAG: REP-associated tyrosine transposase [Terriglobales bacterium]